MTSNKIETLEYVLDMQRQLARLARGNGLPDVANLIDELIETVLPEISFQRAEVLEFPTVKGKHDV